MNRDQHLQIVLQDRLQPMLVAVSDVIEAMKPGEKIPATTLANRIAPQFGMKGPSFYPLLRILINGYPNIKVSRGAKGGIEKLAIAISIAGN